jgi:hypothetical protein
MSASPDQPGGEEIHRTGSLAAGAAVVRRSPSRRQTDFERGTFDVAEARVATHRLPGLPEGEVGYREVAM